MTRKPATARTTRKPAVKATPEPAAPEAPNKPESKLDRVARLLAGQDGATIDQLMAATNWQAHSVRGVLAGALKKRGLTITSEKTDLGRVYRAA